MGHGVNYEGERPHSMGRGRSSVSVGTRGGDAIQFLPVAPEEITGTRLEMKICEVCGRGFLRDAKQRECVGCADKLAKKPEPIPGMTESEVRKERRLRVVAARKAPQTAVGQTVTIQ